MMLLSALALPGAAVGQKWVNPQFDAHRLDYRDLGYPDVNQIPADESRITALLTAGDGKVYGATSGHRAGLFLYDRSTNKVRPLGRIGDARGVHHALLEDAEGRICIGGGLDVLAEPGLTQNFPGGFRAIEEQLWKDVAAPYMDYAGGHLYRYDPAKGNAEPRMASEPCPVEDLGVPVAHNSIYAVVLNRRTHTIYGLSYPDARLFTYDLKKGVACDCGPLISHKVYSGPERAWRSVARGLWCAADGRVYTSGDGGLIVYCDPATKKIVPTALRIPGEYWEAWNYYGHPVVEQFVEHRGRVWGSTSDGFLFEMDPRGQWLVNLGKARVSRRVRAMAIGPDEKLYLVCGQFQEPCKLYSYDLAGRKGFQDLGVLAVDRSPYYAKRAYQFDAMTTGIDGTIFIGESDRRASLFLFYPGARGFDGGLNPSNPR
jgi:hypothetical protein